METITIVAGPTRIYIEREGKCGRIIESTLTNDLAVLSDMDAGFVQGIERLVLAQTLAGVKTTSKKYSEALTTAIESYVNEND